MGRIRLKQTEGLGKLMVEMAVEEFLKHCRLRNLSPKTIRYYEEDLLYFARNISATGIGKISPETFDEFVLLEMDKGNRVSAINSRLCGIHVLSISAQIGSAGGIGDASATRAPRLLPRKEAGFRFRDDAVRDFGVDIHFACSFSLVGSTPKDD